MVEKLTHMHKHKWDQAHTHIHTHIYIKHTKVAKRRTRGCFAKSNYALSKAQRVTEWGWW